MILEKLQESYEENGSFNLRKGELVSRILLENKVPSGYGVYLIFKGPNCNGELIYIGLAGTMNQDGTMKPQGLAERLKAKQEDMQRNHFFANYIAKKSPDGLSFAWFVTFQNGSGVLPAVAEARAMEQFYEEYKKLPELNKEY
jgi:hypothetical protein